MRTFISLLAGIVWSLAAWGRPAPISTVILMPWDFAASPPVETRLAAAGFNHATLYVPWVQVEPVPGQFRFGKFDILIERLKQQGLKANLVLDFGGRADFADDGTRTTRFVIPDWFIRQHPDFRMRDFYGEVTAQPDLMNPAFRHHAGHFVDTAVRHFSRLHGDHILGYAIGLQEEHELKLGQTGYRWRDYGKPALERFQAIHGQPLPVIDYNNNAADPRPRKERLLMPLQHFREAQVKDATCHYSSIIRKHGQKTVGYFGETFSSHDAIYATSVIEELVDCLDIAVIDYNYFDGYGLVASPQTLPMLASYLASSGYQQIMVGAYGERWVEKDRERELLPFIRQSIEKALRNPAVIGFEVGGLQKGVSDHQSGTMNLDLLAEIRIDTDTPKKVPARTRVGIFASKSNFYFWHGEHSNGRNIHQDALTQAYALLSEDPALDVAVFGERSLLDPDFMRTLDAVVVPHQSALPRAIKRQLRAYWERGGILVQDLRLGEFDTNGEFTDDWLHEVFGIRGVHWERGPGHVAYKGEQIVLDMAGRAYANHAVLEARPGFSFAAQVVPQPPAGLLARLRSALSWRPAWGAAPAERGLILRGERSLVFGFLPQLAEGPTAQQWHRAFVDEITTLIARNRTRPADMR